MGTGLRAFVDGYLDVPSTNAAGGLSPSGAGRGRGIERVGRGVDPWEAPFREHKCRSGSSVEDFGGGANLFLQRTVSIRSIM